MSARTVIPFGPQHPVLPEPVQLRLTLEEERVVEAIPAIGYVHRGIEKAAELNEWVQNVFLVERICGICSFLHALCYCQGIETLLGVEPPPRARYLRVVWGELHRLHSHHLWLGLLADSFGFESLFMQFWRNREMIMDLLEMTAGNRVIVSTCTVGGTRRDIAQEQASEILRTLDKVQNELDKLLPVISNDYTVRSRTVGKGVLPKDKAIRLGAVGPVLRASGVAQDVRMIGYAAYGELGFTPVVEQAGDAHARLLVRMKETYQAIDLIRQALAHMPEGEIITRVRGNPRGRTISRVEQPRGEVVYYLAGNGTRNLERLRVRTPTFANVPALVQMLPGCELADVPVLVLSIDPCISCTER
ncbi:MAG: nickel-dependent hydrogenase large subunit [Chloroflexi bacterium]|nr:nickel-dependent hydrogenase large subunit [Chloroflexota bacterium]MCL5107733.1 nickel-dependent hydrogenase large subunit [Chloroflexota bacterium]